MNRTFEAALTPTRKLCNEFGSIAAKKNKSIWAILVCSLVFLALYPISILLGAQSRYCLFFGLFLLIYWVFFDWLAGRNIYRNMNKRSKNTATVYSFDEAGIHIRSEMENADITYPALEDVRESESLFALYINKTAAHLIPKAALTGGTPEEFGSFLAEMTGKPVQKVKKTRIWRRALLACAVVLLTVILSVSASSLLERPTVYTQAPYSITLPMAFQETNDEDAFFAAETDDVYVWAYFESADDIYTAWKNRRMTPEDLVNNIAESFDQLQPPRVEVLENGTACLLYTDEVDGEIYFYCDAVTLGGDAFWFTEFICRPENVQKYQQQFLDWAGTIQIEP